MRTDHSEHDTAGQTQGKVADATTLDLLFHKGRTYNAFKDIPVSDALLEEAVKLAKAGPTAVNSLPLRIVFVRSQQGMSTRPWRPPLRRSSPTT
jgi:3-hydroxypropanoate dehydrogenase